MIYFDFQSRENRGFLLQKFKEYVQKLNLIDDIIFRKMAENREFLQKMIVTVRIFLLRLK